MAKRYSIDEALTLVEQFKADPSNIDYQVKMTDMGRRFPVATALLAAGNLAAIIHGMPYYMTLRKANDGVMNIEGDELRTAIQNIPSTGPGDSEVENGEEEADETDTTDEVAPVKKARKVKAAKEEPVLVGKTATASSLEELFDE